MSLAQLFYFKETFRQRVRKWRQACLTRRQHPSRLTPHPSRFQLEPLEPRVLLSATPTEVVTTQQLEPAAVTVPAGSLPSLDVDLNGQADALSDGIVIIRHLFGFTGTALTDGAVDPAGQRTDPTVISTYLNQFSNTMLDVDLNGHADALSDGILIIRSLFGFTGTALTSGAIDPGGQRTDPAVIATFLDNMNPQRELVAPLLTAGLQQDTGLSTTDAITFNPTITGTMADINQIAAFTAGFDATPVANFVDVLADLQTNGIFTLSASRLAQVAGGTLADGTHTLHLRTTDARGNVATRDVAISLDTSIPTIGLFDLAVTSDTSPLADQQTTAAIVTLRGYVTPELGVTLRLLQTGTTTLPTGTGGFQFTDMSLILGGNPFTVRATDIAGNTAEASRTITRLAAVAQPDLVLDWNQLALDAIRLDTTAPPMATRTLAMLHGAIYDVVNAIDGTPGFFITSTAPTGTSVDAAVASSAHTMLAYLFPAQKATFDAALAADLASVPDGPGETQGVTLGHTIAQTIIDLRAADGWDDFVIGAIGTDPGEWRPTPPMYGQPLLPQWADLTPFTMSSSDQFLPAAPPALDSAAYAAALNEVKALGSATGSSRTAEQTQIARFWADGAGTTTPPGHWNQIAEQIALQAGNSLSANARLFAQLNFALADAAITAWNAKYTYNLWRPVTAIQLADTDGNAATQADPDWSSLLITPPFPSYTSGHSTFSAAAADILAATFGDATAFTTGSFGLPGVTRSFTSFTQAATEAGRSRIYGGIHYSFDDMAGQTSGRAIAEHVLQTFALSTDVQAPRILLDTPAEGAVAPGNFAISGRVLDNLSGVASLQLKIDAGAFAPVSFAADGSFNVATTFALDGSADGPHQLTLRATDARGNVSPLLTRQVTLDTKAPTLTLATPAANASLDTGTRLQGSVNGTGSAIVQLTVAFAGGNTMPVPFDTLTGVFDAGLKIANLSIGAHTLTVSAKDAAGHIVTQSRSVQMAQAIPFMISGHTPMEGGDEVGSTFRPQVFFSRAVNAATLNANNLYATGPTGQKLAATIVTADDGSFAWLFFTNPMPGGATITVHVDGTTIRALSDGAFLDADGNGTAGGTFDYSFSTVSLTPLANTSLTGIVLDPGQDLQPMTFDDIRAGADGILHTSDDVFLHPIAGAKVFILGLENQAVFTDAQGRFILSSVPSGNVKVVLNGLTATNNPSGFYFPEMVMDATLQAGIANTLMGSMGTVEARQANATRPEVYLPRLLSNIFEPVSTTTTTTVGVNAASAPDLTLQEQQFLTIEIQPNSLIGPDGQRLTSGQVGISLVPPELVMDMLPPGVLQHTFDITVQAPGIDRFSTPAPMTFPNVFNAAPGTQLNFLSFDHTTGRLVIEGTATVSADGQFVTTDPGTGITHPGWHGMTPPGDCGGSGGPPPEPPPPRKPQDTENEQDPVALAMITGQTGAFPTLTWTAPDKLPDTPPPPPPPGGECPPPPRPEDPPGKKQPYTKVTIEVEGPLAKFMKKSGNLELTSQSFTLTAGSKETKTFGGTAKTYDELFGVGGFTNLTRDQLYGSRVKITEERGNADGSKHTEKTTHYLYRWVTVIDAELAMKETGDTAAFHRTLTDGFVRTKNVDMHLPSTVTTKFEGSSIGPFDLKGPYSGDITGVWEFDPFLSGPRSDSFSIKVNDPKNSDLSVGHIVAKGTASDPSKIDINLSGFSLELDRVIKALVRDPGADGTPKTGDDRIFYNFTGGGSKTAGPRFLADFAGFLPEDDYTQTALDERIQTEVQELQTAFEADYTGVNSGYNAYTFGTFLADVTTEWKDLGLGHSGRQVGEWDLNNDFLRRLITDPVIGEAAKEWALAEALNQKESDNVEISIVNSIDWTSAVSLGIKRANTVAHESAHTFGLNDAYSKVGGVHPVSPMPDIMNNYDSATGNLSFGPDNSKLLQAALGFHANGDRPLTHALSMYRANINLADNDVGIEDTIDPLRRGPEVAVFVNGADLMPDDLVGFGDMAADGIGGSIRTIDMTLFNAGFVPLVLNSVVIGGGTQGFTIQTPIAGGTTLQPGTALPVTVIFDPLTAGSFSDSLVIASNAGADPTFTVGLSGAGISPTPVATLKLGGNNNLGGAPVPSGSVQRAGLATITNDGAQPLVISGITAGEGAGSFSLLAVAADLASNPISLAHSQSFSFGVAFDPDHAGLIRGLIDITTNDPTQPTLRMSAVGTGLPGVIYPQWGNDFVAIETTEVPGSIPLRAKSDGQGNFNFFLPSQAAYHIVIFDPVTGLVSHGYGKTPVSGTPADLTRNLVFDASTAPDTDFDGLPDDVEFAIGTAKGKTDTDKDGLSDFTEIQQGLDPLGGLGIPTGIVSAQALQGSAQAVVVEGSVSDPVALTVYVATGPYGLAVIDVTQFSRPTVLKELDLPGTNTDVAIDVQRGIAAVAGGSAGLHLVDISNPAAPTLMGTVALVDGANRVKVFDGLAYVASGFNLVSIDLSTRGIRETLDPSGGLSGAALVDLAIEGTTLYTIDASRALRAVSLSGLTMTPRGSVALPNSGGQLFVGNGIAYVGAARGFSEGFVTANVSDPDNLTVLSDVDDRFLGGRSIALNGSDLGVVVGQPGGDVGAPVLDVVSTVDPANTAALITRFDLPAAPFDVVVAGGLAFVANGTAGLQVVNYRTFDTNGVAPSVTLSADLADLDPNTPGIQVQEGKTFRLLASVSDDVQVRNIELLVNNQVVSNDVSFPWDLFATAPPLATAGTTLTIRLRATDTGGNSTLSAPVTLNVVPDTFAPILLSNSPVEGARLFFFGSVDLQFDEAIDGVLLNSAGVSLVNLGPDQSFGTADDTAVGVTFDLRAFGSALLILPQIELAPGDYRLRVDPSIIADHAGNHLPSPFIVKFSIRPASDVKAASGFPAIPQAPSANPGQQIEIVVPWGPEAAQATFQIIDVSGIQSTRTIAPTRLDPSRNVAAFTVPFDAVTGDITVFGGGTLNFSGFLNWVVTDGSVDLIGNGFNDLLPGNGLYVDLDGLAGNADRIETKAAFNLTPGDYLLEFDLAGTQGFSLNDNVTVTLGSLFNESFTRNASDPFTKVTRTITVTALTTAKLTFDYTGGDGAGLLLDNVTLTRVATSEVLLNDGFELTLADGTFLLQIVPVMTGLDVTSVAFNGSSAQVILQGLGFIEDRASDYTFGTEIVTDLSNVSGPNVFLNNSQANLTLPLTAGAFGAVTVKTAGGTSASFSVGITGLMGTALSGTPADGAQASANPGQAVTVTGSGLTTDTDLLLRWIDSAGMARMVLLNPTYASGDGTSATVLVPGFVNGAFALQTVGSTAAPLLQIVPVVDSWDVSSATNVRLAGRGFVEGDATYQLDGGTVSDTAIASGPNVQSMNGLDNTGVDLTPPVYGFGTLVMTTAGGTSAPVPLNVLTPGAGRTPLGFLRDVAVDPASGQLWVVTNHNPAQVHRIDPVTGQSLQNFVLTSAFGGTTYTGGLQILPTNLTLRNTATSTNVSVPAGSLLFVNGTPTPDRIIAVNSATGAVLASLTLGAAQNYDATSGLYDPGTGHVFLASSNRTPDKIFEIDPLTGSELASLALPFDIASSGMALDPVTGNLWIGSSSTNDIALIVKSGPTAGTVLRQLTLLPQGINNNEISGLAIDAQGRLVVSSTQGVVYRVSLTPPVPGAPTLSGITAIAGDGTPANPAQASANVGQVIELAGTNFRLNDLQVQIPTRDNAGNAGITVVVPLAVNAAGTRAQVLVPGLATTGAIQVTQVGTVQNLGFGSNTDAIYRNVTLDFTPTGSTSVLRFEDTGLQGINDESWGLDNIRVALAATPGNPFFTDTFEGGAKPAWSDATTDATLPGAFSQFSGRFSNGAQILTLTGLTPNVPHRLTADLYILDSWEGTNPSNGPDRLLISVDGTVRFDQAFSNSNASMSNVQTFGATGNVPVQIVPTLTGLQSSRPGTDNIFELRGSGFSEGASTLTIGGVTLIDAYPNLSELDVFGARNDAYGLVTPLTLEGPIRVTTAGGFDELVGPGFPAQPPVTLTSIVATAQRGTAANPLTPSANTDQVITLLGQGFTSSTLVQFAASDDTGTTGVLTRTGSASGDGRSLSVEVPALAMTGLVRVLGGTNPALLLQIVPTLRALGGTMAPGNQFVLVGSGLIESELILQVGGLGVGSFDVQTIFDRSEQLFGAGDPTQDQQLLRLTVPPGATGPTVTVTTAGGTAHIQLGGMVTTLPPLTPGTDVGDTLASALPLGLAPDRRVTINGTLGGGTQTTKDVDLYQLTLAGGDQLTINLTGAIDTYVRVFGPDGTERATQFFFEFFTQPPLVFVAPSGGVYTVGVSGYPNTTYNPQVEGTGVAGDTGSYAVEVERTDGSRTSITGLSTTATSGTPARSGVPSANVGQTITLTGSGFQATDEVIFTGLDGFAWLFQITVTPVTVAVDGTSLTVVVPDAATTGRVRLAREATGLLLQIVPTLSDVDQGVNDLFHDGSLTLTGSGFAESATRVEFGSQFLADVSRFNGLDVFGVVTPNFNIQENVRLDLEVPAGVPTGPIRVTTLGGTSAPFGLTFTGITATATSGMPADPAKASANPGQIVTLRGTGFDTTTDVVFLITDASGNIVERVTVPATVVNQTEVTVVVPTDAVTGVVQIVGDQANAALLLQIVPVVTGADLTSVSSSAAAFTLSGLGFIEGHNTQYQLGGVVLPDPGTGTGPDAFSTNTRAILSTAYSDNLFGPVTVTTAGGTSAPFTVGYTQLNSVAATGTPANGASPSANPGQTVTLIGSGFTAQTDIVGKRVDDSGNLIVQGFTPTTVNGAGTQATLTIPTNYNGAFVLHIFGASFAPLLQIVPVVTGADLTSTNFVRVTGQGLVEGNGTVYLIGSGIVTDTAQGVGPDVFSSGTISDLTLPVQGVGNFTVTTAGGTSAPIAWNVVAPGLGSLLDVAYDPATSTLWVADANNISRINKNTGAVISSFDIPVTGSTSAIGLQFVAVAFTLNSVAVPAGSLLITNGSATNDQFIAVNATNGDPIIASLTLGTNFDFVAGVYHAGRNTLFGLDGSPDQLIEIDRTNGATLNTFALGFDVQSGGLAIDAAGNIWIATNANSSVRRFNVTTNTIDQTIDLAKDSISTELTGLANEAPGFVVGSSNRGVVYFQLDPPAGDAPAPTVAMEPPAATTEIQPASASGNLELAYVQQSWVKNFVNGSVRVADASDEEELLIQLA